MQQLTLGYFFFVWILHLLFKKIPVASRSYLLLLASLCCYYFFEPRFFYILLLFVLLSYLAGYLLKSYEKLKVPILITYLLIITSIYLPFKYPLSLSRYIPFLDLYTSNLLLPLGISFFTFQLLSYVFDVFYTKIKAESSLINFALYITFFPQLICGPIERYSNISPQIRFDVESKQTDWITIGFLFYSAFFKKYFFSHKLLPFSMMYDNPNLYSAQDWILGAILTRYQIFFDLSAYTDIALATGLIFGIELTENFNRPFSAITIDDFWRRWHISLSTWIRDYIFYPLVSRITSVGSIYYSLIFSFIFLGIWHGDGPQFIVYGLINGLAIVLTIVVKKKIKKPSFISLKTLQTTSWFITFFILIPIPVVWLHAHSFSDCVLIMKRIFSLDAYSGSTIWHDTYLFDQASMAIVLILLFEAFTYFLPQDRVKNLFKNRGATIKLLIIQLIHVVILGIILMGKTNEVPFFYEQF